MADIFISYKREEQPYARQLADALEHQGWSVWWDPQLRAGERFDDVIEAALREASCVIVMWSQRSVESKYVKDEATYALGRNKLVPIKIEEVDPPFRFEGIHTPQLVGWDGSETDHVFQVLIRDLTSMLGPPPIAGKRHTAEKEAERERQEAAAREAALEAQRAAEEEKRAAEEAARRQAAERADRELQEETKRRKAKKEASAFPTPGTVFRDALKDDGEGPEMVVIPAGTYVMGSPPGGGRDSERPQHKVTIAKPFAMGRYPVTLDEYDRFCEATGRDKPSDNRWGRGTRPVINVSWRDAVAYAKWLVEQTGQPHRLPTEAEWEYAARAGTTTTYYWGYSPGENHANFKGSGSEWSKKSTSPVGSFEPNPFGLYDMLGNVWEWVEDDWHNSYRGAPNDGSTWLNTGNWFTRWLGRKVLRGGSWNWVSDNCRADYRFYLHPEGCYVDIGFRVVRPPSDEH